MLMPASVGVLENFLSVAGSSLVACQGLKLLLALHRYKSLPWHRLLQPGGMPSSHAAVVTSLAITMGLIYGWTSPFFQVAAVFGGIVIYDAITLRRAVGEHARRINLICRQEGVSPSEDLLENLGHTPMEVIVGVLIGVLAALTFFH
ncbi:divergent PAP2 family protein [Pelotomaculum isophthalicicum]